MQTGSIDISIVVNGCTILDTAIAECMASYRRVLIAHLNCIRVSMQTMSADDDRFHELSAERDEILKQLNPNNK